MAGRAPQAKLSPSTTVNLGFETRLCLTTDHEQAIVCAHPCNWNHDGRLHSHHLLIEQVAATFRGLEVKSLFRVARLNPPAANLLPNLHQVLEKETKQDTETAERSLAYPCT